MLKREEAIEKITIVIKTLEIYDDDWHNEIKRLREAIEFLGAYGAEEGGAIEKFVPKALKMRGL